MPTERRTTILLPFFNTGLDRNCTNYKRVSLIGVAAKTRVGGAGPHRLAEGKPQTGGGGILDCPCLKEDLAMLSGPTGFGLRMAASCELIQACQSWATAASDAMKASTSTTRPRLVPQRRQASACFINAIRSRCVFYVSKLAGMQHGSNHCYHF